MNLRWPVAVTAILLIVTALENTQKKSTLSRPQEVVVQLRQNAKGAAIATALTKIGSKPERKDPRPPLRVSSEWLEHESEAMDRSDPNPLNTTTRLKKMAVQMTSTERQFLLDRALNIQASENERALAVYMLTLDPKTPSSTFEALTRLPIDPWPESLDPHAPQVYQATIHRSLVRQANMELERRAR